MDRSWYYSGGAGSSGSVGELLPLQRPCGADFPPDVHEIGVDLGEGRELHFFAHLECMRAVAAPDFRFPWKESLDETRRWLEELEKEESSADESEQAGR